MKYLLNIFQKILLLRNGLAKPSRIGVKNTMSYGTVDESSYRLLVFRQKFLKIKEFTDSGEKTFNLSLNEFAD